MKEKTTFKMFIMVACLFLLTSCMPGSNSESSNQFSLKNKKLFFLNHQLAHWSELNLPKCKQCSFNLYTKKMIPRSMLFKQVNNERGDLVFLATSNIRYSFALQTGGTSYSILVTIDENKVRLTVGGQEPFHLSVNEKQKIRLGLINYHIKLQRIDSENKSVDVVIYPYE